jgi:nitrogen fixation protein FixH
MVTKFVSGGVAQMQNFFGDMLVTFFAFIGCCIAIGLIGSRSAGRTATGQMANEAAKAAGKHVATTAIKKLLK